MWMHFVDIIGGDLVQVLGDGISALAPKKIILPHPKMQNLEGGRRGTHCLLELNVGSVLSFDAVYIRPTIYFTL